MRPACRLTPALHLRERSMIGMCRLCQTPNSDLQDSHIMPAWAYKRARGDGKNPNPVVISGKRAVQISDQVTEYLLCRGCEDRFGKVENPISRLVYQKDGSAPFLDQVGRVIAEADRSRFAQPGSLVIDELLYFGASVLWRASIAKCIHNCRLGARYDEEFRSFLFGTSPFPSNARCIVAFHDLPVNGDTHLASICTMPLTERQHGLFIHRFIVFGLSYYFSVGQIEPAWMNELCANDPPHLIMLAPQDVLIDWIGPWMARAKAAGSLARSRPNK